MDYKEDVILEFTRVEGIVEIRAVSATDGLEVSFMAPAATPQQELEIIAVRKLEWVRTRKQGGTDKKAAGVTGGVRRDRRGGIIV